jgi:hypothetical protein
MISEVGVIHKLPLLRKSKMDKYLDPIKDPEIPESVV